MFLNGLGEFTKISPQFGKFAYSTTVVLACFFVKFHKDPTRNTEK